MKFTSERIMPDYYFNSFTEFMLYNMHIKSYLSLEGIIGGTVLDYGCGLGYGTEIISRFAQSAIGIDVDRDSIARAQSTVKKDNITFHQLQRNDKCLPFDDESFDHVVSFQVIEHVTDVGNYLSEISRVLKPGGLFICTTPNAKTRLYPYQKPWNQHHQREYNSKNLTATLDEYFNIKQFSGINMLPKYQKMENRRVWIRKTALYPVTHIFIPETMRRVTLQSIWNLTTGSKSKNTKKYDFNRYSEDIAISDNIEQCSSFFVISAKQKC